MVSTFINNVLEYLPEEYVQAHEALFEKQGGSFIVIDNWVTGAHSHFTARKFVSLSSDMEKIIAEYNAAGKDWNIFNKRLALGDENLSKAQIYIIRIKPGDPRFTYKIPTGNEMGAYEGQWTSGGMTKGGIKEAVIEGSEVIKTKNTKEILEQFEQWERLQ